MTEGKAILEARALKRHFTSKGQFFGAQTVVRAVDGVDLAIEEGETFAIVGESGCGKSTLARLLVRLIEPSAGQVMYAGADIGGLAEADLRKLRAEMQFIFQDPFSSLNPRMTVGALIEEPLRTHGIGTAETRRATVAQFLSRVGLRPEHADRYPHEFSGGQRQRIAIARAMFLQPKLVVLDEPTSALDMTVQVQIVDLLRNLQKTYGLAYIFISHHLRVVRALSHRAMVMKDGDVVEAGTSDQVFDTPQTDYTKALLSAALDKRAG